MGAKNNWSTWTVLERLNTWLDAAERVAVAASGGVDSTTLAIIAHRRLGMGCKVFHSVSPAVPPLASERLDEIAKREGWLYEVVNTGEFDDPEYLANPVNRCFFCIPSENGGNLPKRRYNGANKTCLSVCVCIPLFFFRIPRKRETTYKKEAQCQQNLSICWYRCFF